MAFKFMQPYLGKRFQVVDASTRGDTCYEGRTGYFWHFFDADHGIDTDTVKGPFASYQEAYDDCMEKR